MANTMLDMPPHGIKIAKRCVNEGMQIDLQSALKLDVDHRCPGDVYAIGQREHRRRTESLQGKAQAGI